MTSCFQVVPCLESIIQGVNFCKKDFLQKEKTTTTTHIPLYIKVLLKINEEYMYITGLVSWLTNGWTWTRLLLIKLTNCELAIPNSNEMAIYLSCYFKKCSVNPITPMSDQDRISPYNINTTSSRKVIRIKKNIN